MLLSALRPDLGRSAIRCPARAGLNGKSVRRTAANPTLPPQR